MTITPPILPKRTDATDAELERRLIYSSHIEAAFRNQFKISESGPIKKFFEWLVQSDDYALFNFWIAKLQRPSCGRIASVWKWKSLRREPREGASPLMMLQPMGPILYVYDEFDTDGDRIEDDSFKIERPHTTDSIRDLIQKCTFNGIRVHFDQEYLKEKTKEGKYITAYFDIKIDPKSDREQAFSDLVRDLASLYCGHYGPHPDFLRWPDRARLSDSDKLVEVDIVEFLVLARANIPQGTPLQIARMLRDAASPNVMLDTVIRAAALIEQHWKPPPEKPEIYRYRGVAPRIQMPAQHRLDYE